MTLCKARRFRAIFARNFHKHTLFSWNIDILQIEIYCDKNLKWIFIAYGIYETPLCFISPRQRLGDIKDTTSFINSMKWKFITDLIFTSSSAFASSFLSSSTRDLSFLTSISYCSALRRVCSRSVCLSCRFFFTFAWACRRSFSSYRLREIMRYKWSILWQHHIVCLSCRFFFTFAWACRRSFSSYWTEWFQLYYDNMVYKLSDRMNRDMYKVTL